MYLPYTKKARSQTVTTINPNLVVMGWGGGGGVNSPSPCWFSFNNSETEKAVTLAFCSIQWHFIRDICAKFAISNLPQSPDIGQNSDGGNSNFSISGQTFIKKFSNSRASDNIDMKLRTVTKFDQRNKKNNNKKRQKNVKKTWRWSHVNRFWRHGHFSDFWLIWSN